MPVPPCVLREKAETETEKPVGGAALGSWPSKTHKHRREVLFRGVPRVSLCGSRLASGVARTCCARQSLDSTAHFF